MSFSARSWTRQAVELDLADTREGFSVRPGNVDRELTKAYTTFNSGLRLMDMGSTATAYEKVVTDLWGWAFDGNKELKSMIQWRAALLAGVPALTFI
jgi:hypothetical protein